MGLMIIERLNADWRWRRILLLTMMLVLLFACASKEKAASPKNLLVLVADDLGWHDLTCYGKPFVLTPNIDRLAREGIRFTQAMLTTPQCNPSRISMLTGQYPHETGAEDLHVPTPENLPMVPAYLAEVGYYSGLLKKSHLGPAGDAQFDYLSAKLDDFSTFLDGADQQPFFLWVDFIDSTSILQ